MGRIRDFFKRGGTVTKSIPTGEHGDKSPQSLEGFVMDTKLKLHAFKYELGDEVIDCVTGFKGVVIYRSQWLNACNTYGVKCRELKGGQPQETVSFDEPQLSLVKSNVVTPKRDTGGPERAMSRPV